MGIVEVKLLRVPILRTEHEDKSRVNFKEHEPEVKKTIKNHAKPCKQTILAWKFFYGATGENRTPDLQVTNLLLYRLSHGSKSSPILQRRIFPVKKA